MKKTLLATIAVLFGALLIVVAGREITYWRASRILPEPPLAQAQDSPQDRIEIMEGDLVVRSGDVITSEGLSALYYVGAQGKRYVFPTQAIYRAWYPEESEVKEILRKDLETIPLAGNVTYRPGMRIVTFESDPAYYVVAFPNVLKKTPEKFLFAYFGGQWKERLDVLPEHFRADYTIGEPITALSDYIPTDEFQKGLTISHVKGLGPNLKQP